MFCFCSFALNKMQMNTEYNEIIEKIKIEREFLGVYKNEMAIALDIDERTYRNIEQGKSKLNLEHFLMICDKLNREPAYFFNGMQNYTFTNCKNSGNHNTYNIEEVNKESLKMLIEALQDKLNKI